MPAGRKPKHEFYNLEIGQRSLLKGKAAKYPHQFINQYNRAGRGRLKIVKEEGKVFAERMS